MASTIQIDLLGASFAINADEDPAYIRDLLRFLSTKIDSVERSTKADDPLKAAILTCLILADELQRERKKKEGTGELAEAERIALSLIDRLDARIEK
jgi:cell division protein ZapA (FtsZ GTPase activity inhibitor)